MFKTFVLFNNQGGNGYDDAAMFDAAPAGANTQDIPAAKICINLKNVDAIQQSGRWVQNPELPRQDDEFAAPARPRRTTAARRAAQVFRIDNDRFHLTMKTGNQFTVMGSFDEIAEILSNFASSKESVG